MEQLHQPDIFLFTVVRKKFYFVDVFGIYFFLSYRIVRPRVKKETLNMCFYFEDDSSSKVDVKEAFEEEASTL